MAVRNEPAAEPAADRVLVIKRTFDAPRSLVFQAWTEARHLVHWSAPHGFVITHCQGELRPGGPWRSCMRSPDNVDHWVSGVYREIVPDERLVFTHAWDNAQGQPGHETVVTLTFADVGGKTEMTFHQAVFKSTESRDGHAGGWNQGFMRLHAYLQELRTGAKASQRELILTRVFDAPRPLVFKAWTDPARLAAWWGPKGFTNPVCKFDARPGGAIHIDMTGPDGVVYPMTGIVREIEEPSRIAFTCFAFGGQLEVLNTATFEDLNGATRLTLHARVIKATPALGGAVGGMEQGWTESLDRLAAHVAQPVAPPIAPPIAPFVITRVFDAPRELVWSAWTQRDRLLRWFGPKGFTMLAATLDLRPGGVFHYCLCSPDGKELWGKFVYREIVPPQRIVLVNSFSDAQGGITRHPWSPDWPLYMLTTTTFTEQAGKTSVTIEWLPIDPTEAERRTFEAGRGSMTAGWTGTFDQLADYLGKA